MSERLIQVSTLTEIADAIRDKKGTNAPILLAAFADEISTIETGGGMLTASTEEEMTALITTENEGKVVLYSGETGEYVSGEYYKITSSGDDTQYYELDELTNPATAEDIASGKEAYGADGAVITGSGVAIPYRHTTWLLGKNTRNNSASNLTASATLALPTQAKNVFARQYYSFYTSTTNQNSYCFDSGVRILQTYSEKPTIKTTASGTTITASKTYSIARGGVAVWLQVIYDIDGLSYTRNDDETINLIGDKNCTWLWENFYVANSSKNIWVYGEPIKRIDLSKSINLTEIKIRTFTDEKDLEKIILPESLESIGEYAFYTAYSLKEVIFDGESRLKSIGKSAFGSTPLTSFVLPQTLESLGDAVFMGSSLAGVINIPSKVSSIGNNPFSMCDDIEGYTDDKSNTVYHIAGNCIIDTANKIVVSGCKNSVIPNDRSVEIIGNNAFRYESLTELTIPESVLEIKNFGVYMGSSTNKATITMLPTTPPTLESTSALSSSYLNKIIVPIGCGETYKTATNWSSFASYIEEATE